MEQSPDNWQDEPTAVRPNENLNIERLETYLKKKLPGLNGPLNVEQFPNGFSNLTYLIRIGETDLVLRRPPYGAKIKTGHDMGREYRILSRLKKVYSKAPAPLLFCENEKILGAPFYLMERLSGIILRSRMPPEMVPAPELMAQIAGSVIDNLVDLHNLDYKSAGLADIGKPSGYVERQVRGWADRYLRSQTDKLTDMVRTAAWLIANLPPESTASLIHNDYKYDNLILNSDNWTEIIGVLDWEMATLGDPLMDLGTTLAYWVEPNDPPAFLALQFSPTTLPGNPTRTQLVERYARVSGRDVSNLTFYYVFGLFKLAVIVQQIYFRFKKGYTQDPRFANLIEAVKACGETAVRSIEASRK